jgi:hypothetical protein
MSVESRAGEIVAGNIEVTQTIYFAAMLDRLRLFEVADRLVQLWAGGMLTVGDGEGRNRFDAYLRGSQRRLDGHERRNVYWRCFGFAGGDPAQEPNREFDRLWLRFLRSVSAYARQQTVADVLPEKRAAGREAVRKAGRELAANLSLHGFANAAVSPVLQRQVQQAVGLLQTRAVGSAYGARDPWQALERVAAVEFASVPSVIRYRMLAQAGASIIRWLATHADRLAAGKSVLDPRAVRGPEKSPAPLETPTDRDVVDACEQWLTIGGVSDEQVDRRSQPADAPDRSTLAAVRPRVREMLESSPAFKQLPPTEQTRLAGRAARAAAFIAQPHRVRGKPLGPCTCDADTWWRLQDVDFPAFVSELIRGVFHVTVDSSIKQMEAYAELLKNVERAVDAFAREGISDRSARCWLVATYPDRLALTYAEKKAGRLSLIAKRPEAALRRIGDDLCLTQRPPALQDDEQEATLVRRARLRLARDRQQLLATMVLMGVNRILVR